MPLERLVAIAARFLSERTFTLVVAPAVADVQFDRRIDVAAYASVLRAIAGGVVEDLTADTSALTFIGLALLPVGYYSFFFLLCAQNLGPIDAWRDVAAIMAVVLVLSMGPVVACYWPAPQRRDDRLELP